MLNKPVNFLPRSSPSVVFAKNTPPDCCFTKGKQPVPDFKSFKAVGEP